MFLERLKLALLCLVVRSCNYQGFLSLHANVHYRIEPTAASSSIDGSPEHWHYHASSDFNDTAAALVLRLHHRHWHQHNAASGQLFNNLLLLILKLQTDTGTCRALLCVFILLPLLMVVVAIESAYYCCSRTYAQRPYRGCLQSLGCSVCIGAQVAILNETNPENYS